MALALWPTLASAQDSPPDTIPFHRHQWAAQFAGGTSFASLGVLRFTAPTRAWLLDFRFTGGHSHDKDYVQDTLVGDGYTSKANVDARIGRRFYQGRGKSVVSFQTVGLLGGYAHACSAFTAHTASVSGGQRRWRSLTNARPRGRRAGRWPGDGPTRVRSKGSRLRRRCTFEDFHAALPPMAPRRIAPRLPRCLRSGRRRAVHAARGLPYLVDGDRKLRWTLG